MNRSTFRTLLFGLLLASGACSSPRKGVFEEFRVTRQHEAGSMHFAVLSVAPWEYYIDALQPRFRLSEDQALAAVAPATRSIENTLVDLARTEVGFEHGGEDDRFGDRPGEAGSEVDLVSNRPYNSPQTSAPLSSMDVSLDPMARYWAATSFFQEVQLLSRYVQDAAVRDGFRPFLVRLQVSLLPSARNEPYDAYCTLSFFTSESAGELQPMTIRSPQKLGTAGDASKRRLALPSTSSSVARQRGSAQVLPLMVTDNLEASVQSSAMQTVRQVAAALSFASGAAAGGADMERISSGLDQVMGSDLNSLLTVARVSDNTLRVRLGAMQQGSAKYAMVPRNHNITLLLMVPADSGDSIQVVAKSTMVDAETGVELPDRDPAELDRELERVMASHEIEGVSPKSLRPLVAFAQANDQRGFDHLFQRLFPTDTELAGYKNVLWLDLVSMMVGGQYSATEFDLPAYDPSAHHGTELLPPQTAMVERGPGDSAVAVLSAAANEFVDARYWNAALEVQRGPGNVIVVPSNGVFVDPLTGQITCTFPPHPLQYMTDSPTGEVTLIIRDKSHERRFGARWNH